MHTPHIPKETEDVVRIIKEITGQPVAGIYLYGSAICGGLRQDSDIDILVIVEGKLTPRNKSQLIKHFMQVSGAIGNQQLIRPLEITMVNKEELSPWQHPVSSELQYGEWLRDDFLKGQLPDSTPDPDLTILLRQVRQNSVTLVGTNAQELIPDIPDKDVKQAISDALPTLLKSIEGDERNTLLTLARMYFTVVTGKIETKDKAADWLLSEIPMPFKHLLEMAKCAYLGTCQDNWQGKTAELSQCVDYLVKQIEQQGSEKEL